MYTSVRVKAVGSFQVVLSACSSYFESLFTTFNEKNQIVILKDTSFADMAACVEFMYKGEVNVPQERLTSLLKTADNLKIRGLTDISKTPSDSVFPTSSSTLSVADFAKETSFSRASSSTGASFRRTSESTTNNNVGSGNKRKRGRPRMLDLPMDLVKSEEDVSATSTLKNSTRKEHSLVAHSPPEMNFSTESFGEMDADSVMERLSNMNIVKMKDYLALGTRQQYWEEPYVKLILEVQLCVFYLMNAFLSDSSPFSGCTMQED
jgi:hypothetical protein